MPLGEDSEAYALDILDGITVKRSVAPATPSYRYLAADIATDFGAAPSAFSLRIAQVSASFGRGANRQEIINV